MFTWSLWQQCWEVRIRADRLLGSSSLLKYHTRFQKMMGCWSTTLEEEMAWSPSFTSRLSSSFHRTRGLRYGTVTGAELETGSEAGVAGSELPLLSCFCGGAAEDWTADILASRVSDANVFSSVTELLFLADLREGHRVDLFKEATGIILCVCLCVCVYKRARQSARHYKNSWSNIRNQRHLVIIPLYHWTQCEMVEEYVWIYTAHMQFICVTGVFTCSVVSGLWFPHWGKAGRLCHRMGKCCWGWSHLLSSLPWSPHHTPGSHTSYRVNSWTSAPTNKEQQDREEMRTECNTQSLTFKSLYRWVGFLYVNKLPLHYSWEFFGSGWHQEKNLECEEF